MVFGADGTNGISNSIIKSVISIVYSVPIRPLARENKASGTESKAIFTEAKATSIINMAHIIV